MFAYDYRHLQATGAMWEGPGQIHRVVRMIWCCTHDIVYNTTKTVCMLVPPKQSQGRYSTKVSFGNEELGFVEEFRCLGHVMTADCRDDKYIKKQFRRQNVVGNMPSTRRQLLFAYGGNYFLPTEAKIQLFKSYCYPIYGCALWRHSYQNSIRKLSVNYSDTFKRLITVPPVHQLESGICDERN